MSAARTIPVIFLMGPTASGKTAMACVLARSYPMEIINVDAAQVYRGMDIGTAKPGREELALCPHHLVDIRDPDESYSAAQFRRDALCLIDEVRGRGHLPVLTGGTMFYFYTLLHGLPELPPSNAALRAEIGARAASVGWAALHRELSERDPRRASEISPTDGHRIQRALEVNALTGRNVAERLGTHACPPWPLIRLALAPALRENLHRRIAARFSRMLQAGLVSEVEELLKVYGKSAEPASLKMVGYREVTDYLKGKVGYNHMMEASIAATRRVAKRQLTWLRNQSAVTWVDSDHQGAAAGLRLYLESHPLMTNLRGRDGA